MTRGRAAFAAAIMLALCAPSQGEERGSPSRPGQFDFYVLSLAWSPTHCSLEGAQADRRQCGSDKNLAFIVHGLWPQFERGYPRDCPTDKPRRVPDELARTMSDIMPSPGLVGHEWRTHGTCTGMSQADYLAATRKAYQAIRLPPGLGRADSDKSMSPHEVERAFIEANPGLEASAIATTCDKGMLDEVRICLTKEMSFRTCPEVDRNSCRVGSVRLPPSP